MYRDSFISGGGGGDKGMETDSTTIINVFIFSPYGECDQYYFWFRGRACVEINAMFFIVDSCLPCSKFYLGFIVFQIV